MDQESLLSFWLGRRDEIPPEAERVARWFAADPVVDREIDRRFGSLVEAAIAGELETWEANPAERVALVLLLDQFPRNLFRGSPRAFAGDPRAIELTRRTTTEELNGLHPLECYFAILPWMHSEVPGDQRAGQAAFARAAQEAPSAFVAFFENGLDFATRHCDVIERFGRFPHRNDILGRDSTSEERAFLEQNPTGF